MRAVTFEEFGDAGALHGSSAWGTCIPSLSGVAPPNPARKDKAAVVTG